MLERKNLKEMLKNGEMLCGLTCQLTDPTVVEIAAIAGFDYVRIEGEHAAPDFSLIRSFVRTGDGLGIPIIMRVTRTSDLTALMDLGVAGIQIPHMQSAEQAKEIVDLIKYAPVGMRGYALGRRQQYGKIPFREYYEKVKDETLLIVQIEDKKGLEHAEEIAAVEGVDVICTGKGDLSQAMGVIGDVYNPLVDEAENRVMAAAGKYGKPCLVVGNNREHWIELVTRKNVAMAEYPWDVELLLNAAMEARKGMEYLKNARAGRK